MEQNMDNNISEGNDKGKGRNFFKDWILPIIIAIVLATIINKFWFFFIKVPTGSMEPTIMPGDKILVTRVYNKEKLQRGDIVVFYSEELSKENNKTFNLVKRLIGLPGDKVVIEENGDIYVNGKKTDEDYVKYQLGIEREFTVPQGKYLFLGDNRANSNDARLWSQTYIGEKDIMGKAKVTVFPFGRFGKLK